MAGDGQGCGLLLSLGGWNGVCTEDLVEDSDAASAADSTASPLHFVQIQCILYNLNVHSLEGEFHYDSIFDKIL